MGGPRAVTNQSGASGARSQKPGTGASASRPIGSRKFDRVLSSKAIQIGHQQGITAEFICKQTAEQTVFKLEHLFTLFDIFQSSLFANDPEIAKDPGSQKGSQKGSSKSEAQDNTFTYEESILVFFLGPNYLDFINQETGEWEQDDRVVQTF